MYNRSIIAETEFRVSQITEDQIQIVRQLIAGNPSWGLSRLSYRTLPAQELALPH